MGSTGTPGNQGDIHGERLLPDPDICRTSAIGSIRSFATCHVVGPSECRHAMGYGDGYLCKHPDWQQFLKE